MTRTSAIFFVIAFLVFSAASIGRNLVWKSEISFWSDVAVKSPHIARAHNNMGSALLNAGRYEEARRALKLALKADPTYVETHFNLAVGYVKEGMFTEAVPEFFEVLRINSYLKTGHASFGYAPRYEAETHANLGNIFSVEGAFDKAIEHYLEALNIQPRASSVHFNLALAYKRLGRFNEAKKEFEEALSLDPLDESARRNLILLDAPVRGGRVERRPVNR